MALKKNSSGKSCDFFFQQFYVCGGELKFLTFEKWITRESQISDYMPILSY